MKTISILCCSILMLTVAFVAAIPTTRERQDDAKTPHCESNNKGDPNSSPPPSVTCLVHPTYSTPKCDSNSHPVCPASEDNSYTLVPACLSGSESPSCVQDFHTTTAAPSPLTDPPDANPDDDGEEIQDPSDDEFLEYLDSGNFDTGDNPSCDEANNEGEVPSCPNPQSFPSCVMLSLDLPEVSVSPVCRNDTNLNRLVAQCELDDGTEASSDDYYLSCLGISTDDDAENVTTIAPEPNTDAPPPDDNTAGPVTDASPTDDNTGPVTDAPPVKTTKKPKKQKKPKPVKKRKCPKGWYFKANDADQGGRSLCFRCRPGLMYALKPNGSYYCVLPKG